MIFISYSHKDKNFVDKLALTLIDKRIKVFVDRWEMKLGDSITEKVQNAISEASHLIIVLSKNSVKSDWCKREITTALMLELERKRVVLLPILLEDCEIPLFLRDKFYADFRDNFDDGLTTVLQSFSMMNNEETGRERSINEPETFSDYAVNWGIRGERFELNIDVVEYSIEEEKPFTVLINIIFTGNKNATQRFIKQQVDGYNDLMKNTIIMLCAENNFKNQNAYLFGSEPFETTLELGDKKNKVNFIGHVKVKRLGPSDGKNKIYYYGRIFERIWEDEIRSKR